MKKLKSLLIKYLSLLELTEDDINKIYSLLYPTLSGIMEEQGFDTKTTPIGYKKGKINNLYVLLNYGVFLDGYVISFYCGHLVGKKNKIYFQIEFRNKKNNFHGKIWHLDKPIITDRFIKWEKKNKKHLTT